MLSAINKSFALIIGFLTIASVVRCSFPGTYETWTQAPIPQEEPATSGNVMPATLQPTQPDSRQGNTSTERSTADPVNGSGNAAESDVNDGESGNKSGLDATL